jgi:hypothetical protein
MRRFFIALPALLSLFLLVSCTKQEAVPAASDLTHATVVMRDGSKVSGTIGSSTLSDITLNVDGGGTRSISMKQVKSINYDDSTAAQTTTPAKSAEPEFHASHYHPERTAIQTKTFEIPAGTEIPVRNEETIDSGTASEGQTYASQSKS